MPENTVILLAEDREDDVFLIRKSLVRAGVHYPVHAVNDGEQAIAYLHGDGVYSNREEYPLPDLFLLDLKLPRKDGFEVLQWVRRQPSLHTLRVVVLTSSEEIRDVNMAYSLGANSFLVKPLDFQNYRELGRFLTHYWLRLDRAPITSPAPEWLRPPARTSDGQPGTV